MSLSVVSCGALEVGEMCTIRFGTVTERAIGIVAVDAISPITTFALSVLTSFVAASTDALACVWPSSEATSVTLDEPLDPPSGAPCSADRPRA